MTIAMTTASDDLRLEEHDGGWRLAGPAASCYGLANDYLAYLADRNYSPRTVRAYGFDLLALCRWLHGQGQALEAVTTDVLLAFLAAKVLGQYDVSLLASAAPTRGRLYFVEANVVSTADSLGIERNAFRTFIAIHEVTHAYEFEAHPWLRAHFAALVEETLHRLAADAGGLWGRLANASRGDGHWMERLMTPAQREAFSHTQALMSLLEGASNHVMHAVGARILPGFDELHERFEGRHRRRGPLEQVVLRLTGLDLKLEQYAEGERFVAAVMAQGGQSAFARVWRGPEWLPSLPEIRAPERWLARADALEAGTARDADTTRDADNTRDADSTRDAEEARS